MNKEMKDSGIEWIGKIPNNWQLQTIGSMFNVRNTKVNDKDYEALSVTKTGVVKQLENVAKTDANDNRKLVLKNDFVINSRSDRKQSCGVSPLDGSVSLINTVLFRKDKVELIEQYPNFLLKNYGFAEEFYRWGHGIVADLWTTRWQEMKSIVLPIPTLEEQKNILEIIKNKTNKINELILNQEQQIEKLKEYKQSLITEVVTKGLDSNVEIKDSGVEWIGRIPQNWEVTKLKNVAFFKTGHTPSTSNTENFNGDINWYTPGDFIADEISISKRKISNYAIENDSIKLYPPNTTLLIGIGGTAGKVCKILKEGYFNQQITAIIAKPFINSDYLFYQMITVKKYLKDNAMYTTLPIINNCYLGSMKFILPSLNEQYLIVKYLDKKCKVIDQLIQIKKEKIEKLNEYKKSLIYEYVTGKKEVE